MSEHGLGHMVLGQDIVFSKVDLKATHNKTHLFPRGIVVYILRVNTEDELRATIVWQGHAYQATVTRSQLL